MVMIQSKEDGALADHAFGIGQGYELEDYLDLEPNVQFPRHNYDLLHLAHSLIGPLLVPIIVVVLINRLAHLAIDLASGLTYRQYRAPLKDLTTCLLGCYQLQNYLQTTIGDDSSKLSYKFARNYVLGVVVVYATCGTLVRNQFISPKTPAQSDQLKVPLLLTFILLATSPMFLLEYLIHVRSMWHLINLRTILSTLSMKFVSQLVSARTQRPLNPLQSLAHQLHPASCIFGPWHLQQLGLELDRSSRVNLILEFGQQLIRSLVIFAKAIFVLLLSMGAIQLLEENLVDQIPTYVSGPMNVYLTAQQFRLSHYYMGYIVSSFLNLWVSPHHKEFKVCEVMRVEVPRSLVQVVVSWNIPMHTWLKMYVFNPIKKDSSNLPLTIGMTYLLSSALHGFKFHIWIVLLSLGLYTWTEHQIRIKLAQRFSACVHSRDCKYDDRGKCLRGHTNLKNTLPAKAINTMFGLLSIAQLAYLGYIFRGNSDQLSYWDALGCWRELYFYGHIVMIFALVCLRHMC